MNSGVTNLPHEMIRRLTDPLARFLKVEAAAGGALLLSTIAAVAFTNTSWSEQFVGLWQTQIGFHIGAFQMSHSLQHWINDGLMTLFFFVVALEIKRQIVLGELRSLRLAMLPLAGALGGMLVPALFYLAITKGQPEMHGWGTVMATDTAFVIACIALLGSRVPSNLRLFLLSLAIFDDIGAIIVVAIGYGSPLSWLAVGLGVLGLIVVLGIAWAGIRSVPVYSFLGIAIWWCFECSGLHPTFAGVILGLMTPTYGWVSDERLRFILGKVLAYPVGDHWSGDTTDRRDLRQASTAAREALSPVERFEMTLHPWVGFAVIPAFALANAGVSINKNMISQPLSLAIVVGLVFGKPIGVYLMSWLAVRFGVATLLPNLSWPLIAGGSMLTGIGFTMSLLIAGLAFTPSTLAVAKVGILAASIISAVVGTLALICIGYWGTHARRSEKI